jgi:hypothetical protein
MDKNCKFRVYSAIKLIIEQHGYFSNAYQYDAFIRKLADILNI